MFHRESNFSRRIGNSFEDIPCGKLIPHIKIKYNK